MNSNKQKRFDNQVRMITAALNIWERGGEQAVTCRAVGAECGVTGQRVHQVFKSIDRLRMMTAEVAVKTGRAVIIGQLQASGHPLAPKTGSARLV